MRNKYNPEEALLGKNMSLEEIEAVIKTISRDGIYDSELIRGNYKKVKKKEKEAKRKKDGL